MEQKWQTVIRPKNRWLDLHFKELLNHRDLIILFVKRTFASQYKQTVLGPLWAIIQPLLTTVIFTVVFGNLAKLPTDGIPPFLFYMCGNISWNYFSQCMIQTSSTFISNSSIFGKVYFPRLVMPISTVFTGLISFGIQLVFFMCFWAYYLLTPGFNINPNGYMFFIPVIIVQMALLGLGVGIIVSALTTKYRDLAMLVTFGVQLWMYATPIAYSSSLIPAKYATLYNINPMTPIVEMFRYAFLGSGQIHTIYYLVSWIITVMVLIIGILLFSRVEKTFMDTI